jgi:hypothetical protein
MAVQPILVPKVVEDRVGKEKGGEFCENFVERLCLEQSEEAMKA